MKPRKGNHYHFKFHDHSSESNGDCSETAPTDVVLELIGELITNTKDFYKVLVVKSSINGNNEYWNIVKSTVIEIKEITIHGIQK